MSEKYYELTAPQKAIWLTEQYYQKTNVNNICGTFYSTEKLDFDLLKKSLIIFLKNNDSFKIKLKEIDGQIKQYFDEIKSIDFELIKVKNKKEQTALEEKIASEVFTMLDSLLFEIVLFEYPDGHGGFVINSHHIISDSWTNGIVANDVALIYAKLKNKEEYLKDAMLSYKTYLQSEIEYKNSTKFEKDKAYWEDVFSIVPEEIATIPSVKTKEKEQNDLKANRLLLPLENTLLDQIKSYCEENKISFYNFFMSVFSLYLGRVSGLDEFVIGTPILNRTNYKEKQITGMFINTLPLKITLQHDKTFLENLKEIAISSMSLLRHQKYSFQYIIEDLRKKDSNLPKLYNVLYSYQITKMNENMDSLNHTTSWTFNKTITDDLDIHMFEWNENNSIQIAYDYKISKYDKQDILDLHARILHIIHQVIHNKTILLKEIEIVTPEEKHQILYEFNNTKTDYPKDKTIVDLFEEQVEKTPNNIAVVFGDQQLTYKELNEKANQLARYLIDNDVKRGNIVGILLDKSLEVIISMFAILKTGACFLPIDISYPEERLNYIINNSNPKIILSSKKINKNIHPNTIYVDLDESTIYTTTLINNLNLSLTPNDSMYVMYTSGSTGTPKGVIVTHKNIIRLAMYPNFIKFTNQEVMIQTGTFVFDACIFEIFGSLLHGFKLYIIKKEELLDINYFSDFLKKKKVTILFLTTGLFNQFGLQQPDMFKNLKYLLTGGDVISGSSVKNILKVCNNLKIINCYGPTENGSYSTCYSLTGKEKNIPIGKPITNSTAYVVSNSGELCPIGVPGELWVGGYGVSNGYLNNPDLTQKNFIGNPFGEGKIYKTGDLVKWLSDGNIQFIGRIDNQVKIRGFRVELSEIDKQILVKISDIKQALTVIHTVNNLKIICSYIIAKKKIDVDKLKRELSKSLPTYMIPAHIIQLEDFPLNMNGKVDKKLLPLPNINSKKQIVIARNETDNKILSNLRSILNLNKISISNSFFELGGDSLSAISFSNKLSKELNTNITVQDIFNFPVIMDLSDYISSIKKQSRKDSIKVYNKMKHYPLSSAQKRIYYASNIVSNSTLYNVSGGIIIDKKLDVKNLKECFNTLIKRHDALRTHFGIVDDTVVQIIEDNIKFDLKLEKASTNNLNEIYTNFVKPFNLSIAPLFKTKLIELKNKKTLLLLDMHHIISDGTSLSILLQELCDLYNGYALPKKEIDYKDFTLWEKEQFKTDKYRNSKEFFVNQFKDEIPLLNMPTNYPRPSIQNFEGSNYHTKLSKEIFKKVNKTAKKLNITPYMLMLSCYYILLSKYTSQDDIVVGTPIIGRGLPELSNMFGMFVNTLALRNRVNHSSTFEDFSKVIKENCLDSFKNENYPFDMLVKDLNIIRDTSRNPLFDVMFVYQNNGYPKINFKDVEAKYFIPNNNVSKFDLTLEIIPIDTEYSLRFEYCTKLFNKDFIKRLASHYINILNAILDNNQIKIADIDMLSEEEKNQILYEFNSTKVDYPRNKTIVDLFEEQVEKTPNNIAIIFENQQLTYKELNEKANQLANFLSFYNISNNSIVGIILPRSLEMIIAILGVLKTGACYIPIDPSFPKDRINYVLKNSHAHFLLKTDAISAIDCENSFNINDLDISGYDNKNLRKFISSESSAYLIYTSGSTGNPKGVILKHSSLYNLTCHLNNYVPYLKNLNSHIAIASITTISFDIFLFETLISLQKGLKVVIANEKEQTNPTLLDALIEKHHIKAIQMTPSRMEIFVNNKEYMPHLSNLRYITLAGEALSSHLKNQILELGNIRIYNGYGPSETTVFSTFTDVTRQKNITIGKPLSNTYFYVFDKDKHLCPIDVPGELYISGDGVGKGYINNEELTNKSFLSDSFKNNYIMYKTGDLVKYLPNKELQYIGRTDNQIKIRGLRIELDEVSKWISKYQDINKVILSSYTDKNNRQYIVAYLTVTNRISINNLKIFLNKHIPRYMIPSYFIILNKLPYLPNGKINKKALPLPNKTLSNNKKYIAPTNKLEIEISQILERLLSVSPISIDDNFFDIGGDSLLAMSLQIELLKLNIHITYSDIFMFPTISELANHITSSSKKSISKIDASELHKFSSILDKTIILPKHIKYKKPGNILLSGVTGFLGSHILDTILSNEENTIYCLIRNEAGLTIEQKLINKLHYYFDKKYDPLIGKRIIPIQADISINDFGLTKDFLDKLANNVDIVINSAAMVSHYGNYSDYKKVNVDGTENLVKFCLKYNKRFYQISTLSVSGNSLVDNSYIKQNFSNNIDFNENNFYIEQSLDNVYVRSKFEAEKIVFNAILSGLDAYIIRIGNLMNRFSDFKFQPNISENAYVNRLISFAKIKCIPNYIINGYLEFTPVDYCAYSIYKILSNPSTTNRVFHLLNHNTIDIMYFVNIFNDLFDNIRILDNADFLQEIDRILKSKKHNEILHGIINDFDENRLLVYDSKVKLKSDFSIKYLEKIDFSWPIITRDYLEGFLKYFFKK